MGARPTTKGLLTHAHGSIALAIMGTHLLLGQLGWSNVVAGRHKLFVSLASAHLTSLHRVVVNLAQRLVLLSLNF